MRFFFHVPEYVAHPYMWGAMSNGDWYTRRTFEDSRRKSELLVVRLVETVDESRVGECAVRES